MINSIPLEYEENAYRRITSRFRCKFPKAFRLKMEAWRLSKLPLVSLNKSQDEELLSRGIGREVGMGVLSLATPSKRREKLGPGP